MNNRAQEIKAARKFWKLQKRPITAIVTYKDWLYSASSIVEGSNLKVRITIGSPQRERAFHLIKLCIIFRNGEDTSDLKCH